MKKKDLISKWLDNNLIDEELKAFEQSSAFSSYQKISEAAKHFAAPKFDTDASYSRLLEKRSTVSASSNSWLKYAVAIAAVVVISFTSYTYLYNNNIVEYLANNTEKVDLNLPDNSQVTLNAGSSLTFDESDWQLERALNLKGEAYFKVAKGEKFTVNSDQGEVTVLGTQFNVKDRTNYFEVSCFEGLVQVVYNDVIYKLPAGKNLKVVDGKVVEELTAQTEPSWINEKSLFKSAPLEEVIAEIERQYDIIIEAKNVDTKTVLTGGFTHKNLDTALQSITIPLNLSYEIQENIVTLKNE